MKTHFLALLALTLTTTHAQEDYLHNRTNIKIGHSTTPSYYNMLQEQPLGNFRMEANFGFFNNIELGGYLGYSRIGNVQHLTVYDPTQNPTVRPAKYIYSNAYSYGITGNFHLLPLFVKSREPRFDIYLSSKVGVISIPSPELSVYRGLSLDYGIYGGLGLYVTRYWGAFAEYGLNKKPMRRSISLEPCLRYGITVKF